jgi:hypothetical protein
MQDTLKNNILIAEFMGMQKTAIGWYDNEEVLKLPYTSDNTFDELLFHKSWDWLIPVVEEIGLRRFSDKRLMGIVTMYSTNRTAIQCYKNEELIQTIDEMDVAGITSTYNAVVRYIEWYNEN